eukprot:gene32220-16778_t
MDKGDRFEALQQQLYQQWPLLQHHKYTVVHAPNTQLPHRKQMSDTQVDASLALEAAQLARLCDLADPMVNVLLLLLPAPPDEKVMEYWQQILQAGDVSQPSTRFQVVFPDNHSRLPQSMTCAGKFLASPNAGLRAVLLAYTLLRRYGRLAYMLNLPLLGPAHYTARTLGRKSATRTLFRSARAAIAPGLVVLPKSELPPAPRPHQKGSHSPTGRALSPRESAVTQNGSPLPGDRIVNEAESRNGSPLPGERIVKEAETRVLKLLSEAMVRCPRVQKWLLKIDNESMGYGHALLDVAMIPGARDELESAYQAALTSGNPTGIPLNAEVLLPLNEALTCCVNNTLEALKFHLPSVLAIAGSEVYDSYGAYVQQMAERGGVIEAVPDLVVGSPIVNVFISPTGQVATLSTHERVFLRPFRSVGSTFPQTLVPHAVLDDAAKSIGAACYRAGVIGHVGIDFVSYQLPDGSLRLWAVDVDTNVTPSILAFQLFDFLTYTMDTRSTPGAQDDLELDGPQHPYDDFRTPQTTPPNSAPALSRSSSLISATLGLGPQTSSIAGGGAASTSGSPPSLDGPPPLRTSMGGSQGAASTPDNVANVLLSVTPCNRFFKMCYKEGYCYDVDRRTGIIFNLSNHFSQGSISILVSGPQETEMYATMHEVLSFIATKEAEVPTQQRARWNISHEAFLFPETQSLVAYMAEESSPTPLQAYMARESRVRSPSHLQAHASRHSVRASVRSPLSIHSAASTPPLRAQHSVQSVSSSQAGLKAGPSQPSAVATPPDVASSRVASSQAGLRAGPSRPSAVATPPDVASSRVASSQAGLRAGPSRPSAVATPPDVATSRVASSQAGLRAGPSRPSAVATPLDVDAGSVHQGSDSAPHRMNGQPSGLALVGAEGQAQRPELEGSFSPDTQHYTGHDPPQTERVESVLTPRDEWDETSALLTPHNDDPLLGA